MWLYVINIQSKSRVVRFHKQLTFIHAWQLTITNLLLGKTIVLGQQREVQKWHGDYVEAGNTGLPGIELDVFLS